MPLSVSQAPAQRYELIDLALVHPRDCRPVSGSPPPIRKRLHSPSRYGVTHGAVSACLVRTQTTFNTPELDVELFGFDLDEAEDLIADILDDARSGQPETFDIDAALDAAGPCVTQPGDLILLGRN